MMARISLLSPDHGSLFIFLLHAELLDLQLLLTCTVASPLPKRQSIPSISRHDF